MKFNENGSKGSGDVKWTGNSRENPLTCDLGLVCLVALRPKSTAKVIAGRSVHLTTLFPGQA